MTDRWNEDTQSQSPSVLFQDLTANVIDGIVLGLENGVSAVSLGISNIVTEIEEVFNPVETGTNLGMTLVDSIRNSLEEGETLIQNLFDTAGELGSIGGVFGRIFDEREIKPLQERYKGVSKAIKEFGKTDIAESVDSFLSQFEIQNLADLEDFRTNLQGALGGAINPRVVNEAEHLLRLYEQRNQTAEELAGKEEKILELQKQQQDLQILETQFKLLDLIQSKGLDASQILGGLELGLDASLPDLIDAMSSAMQQLISTAEGELGIQSPSKVFESIAKNVFGGFVQGARSESSTVMSTMADFTRGIVSTVTGGLGSVINNNQRSRTIELNLNNNFVNQPQVTDRSQLELLLASYV